MANLSGLAPNPMGLRFSAVQRAMNGYAEQAQPSTTSVPTSTYSGPLSGVNILGTPFAVFLGMIVALFLLKWGSESDATELDPFDLRISGYNVAAVGVSAAVFSVFGKVILNRWYVPGLTEFFNFL